MKVNRNELLMILDRVKPGLAKKEIVEQAAHFIFANNEVTTFNDMVCIMHPYPSEIEFSVRGLEFYKMMSGISEEEVDLTMEGSNLKIKTKKTKAALSTLVGEAASVKPVIEALRKIISVQDFWNPISPDFLFGLNICSFSASKDVTSGVKSCCAIRNDSIYTTDNIRASIYMMEKPMIAMALPVKSVLDMLNYEITSYGISENWAHFKTDSNIVFSCKLMKGEYPFALVEGLFSEAPTDIVFPPELVTVVNSMVTLTEGDGEADRSISLTIENNEIECKAQKELSWITKSVDVEYAGPKIKILINPIFFSQILKRATSCSIINNRGMFFSDNFSHILCLPLED
jgi:hypothetical protein